MNRSIPFRSLKRPTLAVTASPSGWKQPSAMGMKSGHCVLHVLRKGVTKPMTLSLELAWERWHGPLSSEDHEILHQTEA